MLSSFSRLATLLLSSATLSLSAPAPIPRSRSRFSKRAGLPEVVIYATGGTIAGSSADTTDVTGYQAGAVAIQTLVDAVPQIANVSDVTGVQFSNVGSNELNTSMIHKLSNQINGQFKANESVAGVVVTHGTDTLEETAFFLDMTISDPRPVVIVGAMRPSTAISADGPYNLLQAVTLATLDDAVGRGALIVLNDRIGSAYYTTKTNSRTLDTFKAYEQGYLGTFVDSDPLFWYEPSTPLGKRHFNITNVDSLPKVTVLYAYQDMDVGLLKAAVDLGAKGIVIAGEGDGSVDSTWTSEMASLMSRGIPIITSTRTGSGTTLTDNSSVAIGSGSLNAQKAKILLQLAIGEFGSDMSKIEEVFEQA